MALKTRAIIYVPDDDDRGRWEAACLKFCERHRYEVVALVIGGPERWAHVMQVIQAGEADVVVVASHDHLAPDRKPRVESVTQELKLDVGYSNRRTRVIRRDGEVSP